MTLAQAHGLVLTVASIQHRISNIKEARGKAGTKCTKYKCVYLHTFVLSFACDGLTWQNIIHYLLIRNSNLYVNIARQMMNAGLSIIQDFLFDQMLQIEVVLTRRLLLLLGTKHTKPGGFR